MGWGAGGFAASLCCSPKWANRLLPAGLPGPNKAIPWRAVTRDHCGVSVPGPRLGPLTSCSGPEIGRRWRVQSFCKGAASALGQAPRSPASCRVFGWIRRPASPGGCAATRRQGGKEAQTNTINLAEWPFQWGSAAEPGTGGSRVPFVRRQLTASSSVLPGALFFTANWTFLSERNNYSPRRRGLAANADVTHNVTLPVKGAPAPQLGSRPSPRFCLIMEVTSP